MQSVVVFLQNYFLNFRQFFIEGDHNYFRHINQEWTNEWFDSFMPFVTDPRQSLPFIVFVLAYMIYQKREKVIPILLGCIVAVALADVTAARLIKPLVQRPRPEVTEKNVRLLVPHQGSFGFPSNHAANTSAAAFFLLATYPLIGALGLLVAIVIAYSRVYVGVHYPLDVMGGALLGFLCAVLVYKFYLLIAELMNPIPDSPVAPKAWKKRKIRKPKGL